MLQLSSLGRHLGRLVLLLGTALLLTACPDKIEPEKADLLAIAAVFQETGFSSDSSTQYQQRISEAKTEAQMQALVLEIAQMLERVPPKLDALALRTEEAQLIRQDLSTGISQVASGMKQALTVGEQDAEAMKAVQEQLLQGQQRIQQGFTAYAALAKKYQLPLNLTHPKP